MLKHAKDTYFDNEWSEKYLVKVGLNVIDLQQDKKSKLTRISKKFEEFKAHQKSEVNRGHFYAWIGTRAKTFM